MPARDHRRLKAFELADRLAVATYHHTRLFPRAEAFGLTSQLRRAAVSIPSNIVEGCARHSEQDYLRFLDMAYGSARELEYQLSLATRLGFLEVEAVAGVVPLSKEVGRVLFGLIDAIRNPKGCAEKSHPHVVDCPAGRTVDRMRILLKLRTPDSSLRTEPVGRGLSRWRAFYSDGLLAGAWSQAHQGGVLASEPERVGQESVDLHLAGPAGNHVQRT